jgi:hypothetical protein
MLTQNKDPYSNYDLDDWQWEFLRRNPRYIKAYKAIEWLKKRLNKTKEKRDRRAGTFNAFGVQCSFQWIYFSNGEYNYEGWVYRGSTYESKTRGVYRNDAASGSFLDLPSPSDSAKHYKEKLLKKGGVVSEIEKGVLGDGPWDVWTPMLLKKYEIAVEIDTRYSIDEILNGVREIIFTYQEDNRNHVELYSDYLRVWQLRKDNVSRSKIASSLWPGKYKKNKTNAIQKTRHCEKKSQELIDESFPAKKHSPKNKK